MMNRKPTIPMSFWMVLMGAIGATERSHGQSISQPSPITNSPIAHQNSTFRAAPLNPLMQRPYVIHLKQPALAHFHGNQQHAPIPRLSNNRLDQSASAYQAYKNHLKSKQTILLSQLSDLLDRPIDALLSFQISINGLVINLTAAEAQLVASHAEVRKIQADRMYRLNSDVSPQIMGAENVWNGNSPAPSSAMGAGIVVAVFDSGVNFDHPSFADVGGDGFDHQNPLGTGHFLGVCDPSNETQFLANYTCNDKLFGGYDWVHESLPVNGLDLAGPEDENGHGSHTASIAVGNVLHQVNTYDSSDFTTISGVAPHANLIIHDVCFETEDGFSCPGSAIIAATEQTLLDGLAHVINLSISGGTDPWQDDVSLALLSAVESGIFVATSANSVVKNNVVMNHLEPWTTSATATTHQRNFHGTLNVLGPTIDPQMMDIPLVVISGHFFDLPIVTEIRLAESINNNAQGCDPFPAASLLDAVVLMAGGACDINQKISHAQLAGAQAIIIHQDNSASQFSHNMADIPVMIATETDGLAMNQYIMNNPTATTEIMPPLAAMDNQHDMMAHFSADQLSPIELIKPNLAAPGLNVLAAFSDSDVNPSTPAEFGLLSGTSMSAAMLAGSAALLSETHPSWSPLEIQSALMLSAHTTGLTHADGNTSANAQQYGAGRTQVDQAAAVKLTMHETADNFLAADPANGGDPKSLNVASYFNSHCAGTCVFQRQFTNTSPTTVSYRSSLNNLPGHVSPSLFSLDPGQSIVLNIEIHGHEMQPAVTTFGQLTLQELPPNSFTMTQPISITDGQYHTNDPISAMDCGIIPVVGLTSPEHLSIELAVQHTWIGDLTLKLFNPIGDEMTLLNRPMLPIPDDLFGSPADLSAAAPITFMDGAPTDAETMGLNVGSGVVCADDGICEYFANPDEELNSVLNLNALLNGDPNGDWLICGGDSIFPDPGIIHNAVLTFSDTPVNTQILLPLVVIGFNDTPDIELTPELITTSVLMNTTSDISFSVGNSPSSGVPLNWELQLAGTSNQVMEVFYQQTQTGQFNGIVSSVLVDGISDPGVYAAEDFTINKAIEIDGFEFDGFMSNAAQLPHEDISAFTVSVYADDNGQPAGHPEDGIDNELFSATIPTDDNSFEVIDPNSPQDGVRLNVRNFTGNAWNLEAGTYWIAVYAEANGEDHWAWMTGHPNNSSLAQFIDPQDVFELGFTQWTDLVTVASGDTDYAGLAMKIHSLMGCGAPWLSYDVTSGSLSTGENVVITASIDSHGLTPGVYQTAICINSNDPSQRLAVVPFNLTVHLDDDLIFLNGYE